MININAAPAEDLDRLPGIGRTIAARIVEYREKNGKFTAAEGLLKVKGITAKKLEKFKRFVTTGDPEPATGNTGGNK